MNAVLDTNIVIDLLHGVPEALREINRYKVHHISVVTWMEILAGARSPGDELDLRRTLASLQVIPLQEPIAEEAVRLRREHKIRLPDAIIWATARTQGLLLVTRNSRDFPATDPGIRIPYRL